MTIDFDQARREEQAQVVKEEGKDLSPDRDANDNKADWDFAHSELLEREGVDLKVEMEQKMKVKQKMNQKNKNQRISLEMEKKGQEKIMGFKLDTLLTLNLNLCSR